MKNFILQYWPFILCAFAILFLSLEIFKKKKKVIRSFEIHQIHPGTRFIVTQLDDEPSSVFVRFTKPPKWMKDLSDIESSIIKLNKQKSWLEVGKEYEARELGVHEVKL